MTKEMIYMNLGIVVVTIIAFIYFTAQAKLKASKDYEARMRKKIHNKFSIYFNNLILRGKFRRIVEMYSSLSAYDLDTVKKLSVKLFERNCLIVVLIPIVAMVVMRDITVTILMAFMGIVYYEIAVEKENDKIYMKLMEDFSLTLASLREKYLETDSIPLACLYCEKSDYLEVPMNNIYHILTDVDGEEKLENFQHTYPVRIIKTLANVCHIVSENGAVKKDNGADSFSDDLTVLRQECDSEIRRLVKTKIAFNSLQMLSLAGLVIMPVFEMYLLNQIPGTAVLLKGFYGVIVHAIVVISSIYSFNYISSCTRPSVVNQIDKMQSIDNLSKKKIVWDFVKTIVPKKYKTKQRLDASIRDSLSSKDMRYIYTAKLCFSAMGFVGTLILLIFGTITVHENFRTNYNSLSFIPQSLTANQQVQLKAMDDEFMELSWDEYIYLYGDEQEGDAELQKYIEGHMSGMADSDYKNQVTRLRTKYENYHNSTWKWYFILIAFGVAVVCWFMPELSLSQRKKLVAYEAAEDISQLQTIMIVLSETKMDVYKAICWLENQATVHKAAIKQCHFSYIADPEVALERLEKASPNNDFKRLVRKLKSAVYTLSLHDAFSDMALDKSQSLTLREMLRGEELESRKNSAKMIAILPAGAALVGSFMGPVLILGVSQMLDTLNSLQGFGG